MCDPITLAVMAATGASGVTSLISNSAEAYVKNEQLKQDMTLERIRGEQASRQLWEDFASMEAENRVAMSVMGGQNMSYEQGIAPKSFERLQNDLGNVAFNVKSENARRKYGIKVNSSMAVLNAFTDAANTAISMGSSAATGSMGNGGSGTINRTP